MKKHIYAFIFLAFFIVTSCFSVKKIPTEPVFYSTATATKTCLVCCTLTATSTTGPALTATPTITITVTQTQQEPGTATATPSCTTTATEGSVCYIGTIAKYGQMQSDRYFNLSAGTQILTRVYGGEAGIDFSLKYHDGSSNLLQTAVITTGIGGYATHTYTVTGTESSGAWKTELYSAATLIDDEPFYVINAAPTPTATLSAMNMLYVYSDSALTVEKRKFRINACSRMYFASRFSSYLSANIGWYDAAGALAYSSTCTIPSTYGNITSSLSFSGAEQAGSWHIVTFDQATPPPATFSLAISGSYRDYLGFEAY